MIQIILFLKVLSTNFATFCNDKRHYDNHRTYKGRQDTGR